MSAKDNFFKPARKNRIIKEFIENLLDCVISIDTQYIIKQVNQETLSFLGYREDQVLGKRVDLVFGGDVTARWDVFCEHFSRWPLKNHDILLKNKGGVEIPVKINITPIIEDNTIKGWFITAKDMSSTRELIRELARSKKDLQYSIGELEESRNELVQSEKLSFAGRMAASIAHEIRNPLNIIGMAVQQLHNELRKRDSRREYTETILNHIKRVDKLIDEFVSVARPPKLKMHFRNINDILEDVLKLLQPKIHNKKIKLYKEFNADLPKVRIDEEHMTQAFSNILLNACDAAPKKGGKIWVSSEKDEKYVVNTFRNTGKPINRKDLIKIFDPFFSTKRGGTGLGMSIAYTIIGSHRGTISVESNKKVGTIMTVKIPI